VSKISFFGFVLSVLLISACDSEAPSGTGRAARDQASSSEQDQKALSVLGERVSRRPISTFIISNTTLEAVRDVTVYAKLNAIIAELGVEEGDVVQQGKLLARLDDREIRNGFDQAKIALDQAELGVRQAEVRAQISESDYERALSLFEQKLTSQQEFDQAALATRTDNLALEDARQQLEAAEARLEATRIQLEYTTITSPISGVITVRLVDVGDRVNVNEALFTVLEFPPLWARIFVPEKSLPELRIGQSARIEVETYPDRGFEGRILRISPTVDSSSGTVKVTIQVNRPGQMLRPGMFGTVHIATETRPDALVIPKKAITRERDLNFVYSIQPDRTVIRKEVQLGFAEENWVEVVEGLEEGEAVVTVGHETLNDGYPVLVQNWTESEQEPAQPAPGQPDEQRQLAGRPDSGSPEGAGRRPAGAGAGNRGQVFERMMQNPEVKERYEARLAQDPGLATDPEKRRAFFREEFARMRDGRAQP
jgi:membrane fusion protein (multidrug efflux system)